MGEVCFKWLANLGPKQENLPKGRFFIGERKVIMSRIELALNQQIGKESFRVIETQGLVWLG